MKKLLSVGMLVCSFIFVGCATMFNSGTQSMQIMASDGGNHEVDVTTPSGSYKTKLPTTVTAAPSTFKDVSVRIDGTDCLNPTSRTVGKGITLSYWVNILNAWGFLIDPVTGAMWTYDTHTTLPISKKSGCK